jgi:hypothetical protein
MFRNPDGGMIGRLSVFVEPDTFTRNFLYGEFPTARLLLGYTQTT